MLKAYKVECKCDYEGFAVVVYAETASKAKMAATLKLDSYEDYTTLRARRLYYMDGTEHHSELNRQLKLFDHGWWFEYDGKRYDSDNVDEFLNAVSRNEIPEF